MQNSYFCATPTLLAFLLLHVNKWLLLKTYLHYGQVRYKSLYGQSFPVMIFTREYKGAGNMTNVTQND